MVAQGQANLADYLAPPRRRDHSPVAECFARPVDDAVVFLDRGRSHRGERLTGRRIGGADHGRSAWARLALERYATIDLADPQPGKQVVEHRKSLSIPSRPEDELDISRTGDIGQADGRSIIRVVPVRPRPASAPDGLESIWTAGRPYALASATGRSTADRSISIIATPGPHRLSRSTPPESELRSPVQRVDSTHLLAGQLARVVLTDRHASPAQRVDSTHLLAGQLVRVTPADRRARQAGPYAR